MLLNSKFNLQYKLPFLGKAAVIEGTEPNFSFTVLLIVFKCTSCFDIPALKLVCHCVVCKDPLEIGCVGFCFIREICALLLHNHVPSLVICEFLLCQWSYAAF